VDGNTPRRLRSGASSGVEIKFAGGLPAFEAALDERGTHGKQDRYTSRRRALAGIKGAELDGELVRPRIPITDQLFCSGVKILFGTGTIDED
jgi:hypothetical protein